MDSDLAPIVAAYTIIALLFLCMGWFTTSPAVRNPLGVVLASVFWPIAVLCVAAAASYRYWLLWLYRRSIL